MPKNEGKENEQNSQPLSIKWVIIFIAIPVILYFSVKTFNIDPVQIIFGILIIVKVIIPLGIGIILFISLIFRFSNWIEGKAPTEKHKAKCRVCGREFEPPLGNKLHTIHIRTAHKDFLEKERTPRHWLSLFVAMLFLEAFSGIYALVYSYNFSLTGLIFDTLSALFGLRIPVSSLLINSLMFIAVIILGLYYYRILKNYRNSYLQNLPEKEERTHGLFEKTLGGVNEQNKQEPRKSEAPLSELDELIKKAYESEDEKTE